MDRVREMEEKLEAVVNPVVNNNNHIPHDLAFSILSKLPLKSLKRFGCICTSWSLIFENPYFMTMFCNNSADASLLLKQDFPGKKYHSLLYLLTGERFENRVHLDFLNIPFHFHVLGSSVNGILCLNDDDDNIALWNPTTKEFKVVPPSPFESKSIHQKALRDCKGFGYDHVRDDYKVIRYLGFPVLTEEGLDFLPMPHDGSWPYKISFEPLWEIYSLRSDSWKKLDCEMHTDFFWADNGARAYTDNGMCHWWGTDGNCRVLCLVSFDLSNEVFFTTPIPSYMGDGSFNFRSRRVHLAVINESIAFISNYAEKTTIEVSILGEVGVKESWTKLFIVGPLPCAVNLIGMGKKGDIFFMKKDDELAWFDWSTHMIVDLGLKGIKSDVQIVTYKENFESLISIGFENL